MNINHHEIAASDLHRLSHSIIDLLGEEIKPWDALSVLNSVVVSYFMEAKDELKLADEFHQNNIRIIKELKRII